MQKINKHKRTTIHNILSPKVLDVIRIGNFRHLWIAQIFSQVATNTLLFVLALKIYQMTSSNTAVSVLFLVYAVPAMLIGVVAGTVVDKFSKRDTLLICDLSRMILVLFFIIFHNNLIIYYIITGLNALITQFYVPSEAPLIPRFVPKKKIIIANSLFSLTYFSSLAVGSMFAGPLLKYFGDLRVYIFISILFLIAAFNVRKIPTVIKKRKYVKVIMGYSFKYLSKRMMANIKEAIYYVKANNKLSDALILLIGTQIIIAILGSLGPGFADKTLRIDVTDVSTVIMAPAVMGLIIGALWLGNFGFKYKSYNLIQTGLISAGIILISITTIVRFFNNDNLFISEIIKIPFISLMFFLLGFANSMLDVPANSTIQSKAKGELRGRVYGILTSSVGGIGILPVILGGIIADTVGVNNVFLALGIIISIYGLVRIKYKKSYI